MGTATEKNRVAAGPEERVRRAERRRAAGEEGLLDNRKTKGDRDMENGPERGPADYGQWLGAVCRLLRVDARIGHEALAPRLMGEFRAGMPPARAAQRAREWITSTDN